MANKTLRDMFPDATEDDFKDGVPADTKPDDEVPAATKAAKEAASELLNILDDDEGKKDHRIIVKVSERTFLQFNAICKKKGINGAVYLRPYILDFIRENKHLLE